MSPVMAIEEWPKRSATALMCTPDSSHATEALCRRVCTPTPFIPAFFAAIWIVRSMLRGSTGVPNSVANTSPASLHWSLAAFGMLLRAVLTQHGDQWGCERDGPTGAVGLGFGDHQLATDLAKSPPDRENPNVEVDVGPVKRKHLTETHAGGCDQRERVAVPQSVGTEQELGHVDSAGVLCLLAGDARTFDGRCGVLGQQAVTDRAVESGPQNGIHLANGRVGQRAHRSAFGDLGSLGGQPGRAVPDGNRCRAMATSLGFEGHIAWVEAMP